MTIFTFPDTSELLGWYEVRYEDGFVAVIEPGVTLAELYQAWGRGNEAELWRDRSRRGGAP